MLPSRLFDTLCCQTLYSWLSGSQASSSVEVMVRAAVYYGPNDIRAEDVPRPEIGPGELLVKVAGCGLCGSDIVKIRYETVKPPAVFGHEVVGEVAEVGAGVAGFTIGDRVVVAHHVPCYACHYCQHQSYSMCRIFKASNIYPGGFAEYVRVPGRNVMHSVFHIPSHLSYEAASFTEPIACCLRAIKRSRTQPLDSMLVVGLGSIGLLMVQLARLYGCRAFGVDVVPERVQMAQEMGAEQAWDASSTSVCQLLGEATEGRGADVVMLTAGTTQSLAQALELVRDGGTVNMFAGAPLGARLDLDINDFYHRELTLLSSYSPSSVELYEALGLLAAGRIEVSRLLTHRLPLQSLGEAVRLTLAREALKAYIVVEERA